MIGIDPKHIALASAPQCYLDSANPVDAVGRDPGERHACRDRPLDHPDGEPRLGGKGRAVGHMRLHHPRRVVCPGLRQIQRPVDEGMAAARHVGGEHSDLAIGDLARRSGVLTADTAGRAALLEEASLVDDQHRIISRQVLDDIVPHDVAQRIRVPSATAQNGLLAPRPRIASRLRAHPAGLAALIAQHAVQEQTRRRCYPLLREQRPDPRFHIPQRRGPKLQRRLDRSARHP